MLALAGQASAAVITVNLAGTGTGTVTSVPAGINCSNVGGPAGPACSFNFAATAGVKLTATPSGSNVLRSWTGNSTNSSCNQGFTNPCFVNGTSAATIAAEFGPQPDPAVVSTGGSSLVRSYSARLAGTVNPNGFLVGNCRFEYGKTTDYGQSVPCSPTSVGSGTTDVNVRGFPAFLDPATTYHYRVVATTVGGTATGGGQTFTTGPVPDDDCPNAAIRAQQRVDLPYCMALEMVTPPNKENAKTGFSSIGADGDVIRFFSLAALADTPSLASPVKGDSYVAERTATGWRTVATTTPAPYSTNGKGNPQFFSSDFRRWFALSPTAEQVVLGTLAQFDGDILGNWSIRNPLLVPISSGPNPTAGDFSVATSIQATTASADLSHTFFRPFASGRYLPGDPPLEGPAAVNFTYVSVRHPDGSGSLELLTRAGNGQVWGGNCSNVVGGGISGTGASNSAGTRQGAVSPDGRRVFFTARPTQPSSGVCDPVANKQRIMKRVEAPGGVQISQLISNECDRVAPACDTTDSEDFFQGASVDGTKVYFTTTRQLADSDLDTGSECSNTLASSNGCDLYLFDSTKPAGQRLTQVSAGDGTDATPGADASVARSIAAISGDGSRAYFVSPDVLTTGQNPLGQTATAGQPNLYVFHRDGEGSDELSFVATLVAADNGNNGLFGSETSTMRNGGAAVPLVGNDPDIGGDGHVLVFQSAAALTADDTDGARRDVYRYDPQGDTLERISKAGPDGNDNGAFDVDIINAAHQEGPDTSETSRWVSENGDSIVFATAEGLANGNANARFSVYLWRDGELAVLPGDATANMSSDGGRSQIDTPTISRSGDEVIFGTTSTLLPADGDITRDLYVVRVDGGFPFKESEQACDSLTGGCQGSGAAPVDTSRGSGGGGAGNASPGERARLAVSALSRAQRVALAQGRRVKLRVRSNVTGRVAVRGSARVSGRSRLVVSARRSVVAGRSVAVSLRLSDAARRQLARSGRLNIRLSVGLSSSPRKSTSTVLLKRAVTGRGGAR